MLYNSEGRGGSWTPSTLNNNEWIEVKLYHSPLIVTAIETRGAHDREEWVTQFEILYKIASHSFWYTLEDEEGNRVVG